MEIKKYKVLYKEFGEIRLSDAYYESKEEYEQHNFCEFVALCLESERIFKKEDLW